jgi:hypothetical protein
LPGAIHDQELVFEEKRLRNDGTDAARTEQPSQDGNEMDEKNGQIAHRRMVAGRGILRNLGRNNNSPATGTAVLCEVDRKSLKHGDRFKIELARCLNVVLAWHPSDDMKQGRWRIVFQPLRDERRMVFDAEPW